MRASRIIIVSVLASFCLVPPTFLQAAGNARDQLARKISEAVEELYAVRMERLRLQKQRDAELAEVEQQINSLKNSIQEMDTKLRNERALVDDLKTRIKANSAAEHNVELVLPQAVELVTSAAESIKSRVKAGIPYHKKERYERILEITTGLKDQTMQIQAGALKDYLLFVAEELRLAKSTELWNEPILLDGGNRQKHAYQVRLGLVNHFFISEDGQTTGLADKKPSQGWELQLASIRQRQLRVILSVLQERRPPEITSVPFAGLSRFSLEEPEDCKSSAPSQAED